MFHPHLQNFFVRYYPGNILNVSTTIILRDLVTIYGEQDQFFQLQYQYVFVFIHNFTSS